MKNFRIKFLTLFLVSAFAYAQSPMTGPGEETTTGIPAAPGYENGTNTSTIQDPTAGAIVRPHNDSSENLGPNMRDTTTTGTSSGFGTDSTSGLWTVPAPTINTTTPSGADTTGTLGNDSVRTECAAGDTACREDRTSR